MFAGDDASLFLRIAQLHLSLGELDGAGEYGRVVAPGAGGAERALALAVHLRVHRSPH